MKITREDSCFRPLFANGKQIDRIVIYDEDQAGDYSTALIINRGWVEHTERKGNYSLSRDVVALDLDPVLNRRKIKLDGSHFLIMEDGKRTLYIFAPVFESRSYLNFETYTHRHYSKLYTVKIPATISDPEGKKEIAEIQIEMRTGEEVTDAGKDLARLQEQLDKDGIAISGYNLEQLHEQYTITKKG